MYSLKTDRVLHNVIHSSHWYEICTIHSFPLPSMVDFMLDFMSRLVDGKLLSLDKSGKPILQTCTRQFQVDLHWTNHQGRQTGRLVQWCQWQTCTVLCVDLHNSKSMQWCQIIKVDLHNPRNGTMVNPRNGVKLGQWNHQGRLADSQICRLALDNQGRLADSYT